MIHCTDFLMSTLLVLDLHFPLWKVHVQAIHGKTCQFILKICILHVAQGTLTWHHPCMKEEPHSSAS